MHESYMRLAIAEARRALEEDEVPVGAVIVHADRWLPRRTISASNCEIPRPMPK